MNKKAGRAVRENEDPVFFKYIEDTHDLSKAMDLSSEWYQSHGGYTGEVNTNNYHELELERDELEERIRAYGLNREDFKEEFEYYDDLIESFKRDEKGKKYKLTKKDLIYHLNSISHNYSHQNLYYDDPDFFDEIEKRRKQQLESVFKSGKDVDLDYGDPMVTHKLAGRFMKRLKNGEITQEELLKFLEENEN